MEFLISRKYFSYGFIRYWINRLHEALHPAFYYVGTLANLDVDQIPESKPAIQVLKRWLKDLLYIQHKPSRRLLTFVYRAADLAIFFDKINAREYIHQAPVLESFVRLPEFRRGTENTSPCIVHEVVYSLLGLDEAFIARGILFLKSVHNN